MVIRIRKNGVKIIDLNREFHCQVFSTRTYSDICIFDFDSAIFTTSDNISQISVFRTLSCKNFIYIIIAWNRLYTWETANKEHDFLDFSCERKATSLEQFYGQMNVPLRTMVCSADTMSMCGAESDQAYSGRIVTRYWTESYIGKWFGTHNALAAFAWFEFAWFFPLGFSEITYILKLLFRWITRRKELREIFIQP